MRYFAVLAVIALVGCQQAQPPKSVINSTGDGNTNISEGWDAGPGQVVTPTKRQYVADHHCVLYARNKSTPILGSDGTIDDHNGWNDYKCPNGVTVIIHDGEGGGAK